MSASPPLAVIRTINENGDTMATVLMHNVSVDAQAVAIAPLRRLRIMKPMAPRPTGIIAQVESQPINSRKRTPQIPLPLDGPGCKRIPPTAAQAS